MKADRADRHVALLSIAGSSSWRSSACRRRRLVGAWRSLQPHRQPASSATPSRTTGPRTSTASRSSIARPGRKTRPVVLLLHGFPTSSHMFRNLIPALADRYHVIAPDYPGYGQSGMPDRTKFAYTFDHFADLVDGLLDQLGVKRYAMYVMDYGAPVGWRLALKHPERVTGLIVQNGNAYEEGLKEFWDPIKAYWADDSDAHRRRCTFWSRPRRRSSSTPTASPMSAASRPTTGSTIRRCSIVRATPTSRWTSSTTIAPTCRSIPPCRPSSASTSRRRSSSGARTTRSSRRRRLSVQARPARRRVPPPRHRPFRARGQGRRDGPADPRFPGAKRWAEIARSKLLSGRLSLKRRGIAGLMGFFAKKSGETNGILFCMKGAR